MINCGPCAPFIGGCLASLESQTYRNWRTLVTVDPCGDETYDEALKVAQRDRRIAIRRNSLRRYAMENLVCAIRQTSLEPEDVIVILDGDDKLNVDHALSTVAETYNQHDCWLTYGSWVSNVPERHAGKWPAYPAGTDDFRAAPWLATHLRTWKRWLWDLVNDDDLRDDEGRYFRVAVDLAVMIPLLEIFRDKSSTSYHRADLFSQSPVRFANRRSTALGATAQRSAHPIPFPLSEAIRTVNVVCTKVRLVSKRLSGKPVFAYNFSRNRSLPLRTLAFTSMRKPYRTDLTDEQWKLIKPLIPPAKVGGRPREVDMREILNTLLYQDRTGCQWDMLPHDLLPKSTVYDYFAQWRDDGTWQRIVDALRRRSGCLPVGSRRPGSRTSTARRSRPPKWVASEATTATRRSPGGSGISPSTPWDCCWRSWSRRLRSTTGRRRRRCWGNWAGGGILGWIWSMATASTTTGGSTPGSSEPKPPSGSKWWSGRQARMASSSCPGDGSPSGALPGWDAIDGIARTTRGSRSQARRGFGSARSAGC